MTMMIMVVVVVVITTIVMTMATMMTIELVKMFSCGASVKVIGTSRGCQRHFRGFRGISWASNGCENAETFNLFSILRQSLCQS